jgi:toxin ParE1/3/4
MSNRIRTSARADDDIAAIASWIARNNERAAMRRVDGLTAKFQRLLETPMSGTNQSHLRPGLRSSPIGNYLVFYKLSRDGIDIIRVIHAARDYARFFREDETED